MELRLLHPDGRLIRGTVLPALSYPVTFDSARKGMPAETEGGVDLRSAGITLDKTAGTIFLERFRPNQAAQATSYRVPHVMLLVLEPGTQTRLTRQDGDRWVFAVTPSGELRVDEKGHWMKMEAEKAPQGALAWTQKGLDWEFHGHVDPASQSLCDVLVRTPAGLVRKGVELAFPTTASSLEHCLRFLTTVPEADLQAMSGTCPQWTALVAYWEELVALLDKERPFGSATMTQKRLEEVLALGGANQT